MRHCRLTLSILAATLFGGIAAAETSTEAADAAAGKALYVRYCTSCHGQAADGDGPMRPVLVIRPADLRHLSAGNDGVFPLQRVIWRIDGRDPVLSHGSMMPVYGEVFGAGPPETLRAQDGRLIETTEPMADLIAYLRGLQIPQP